MIPYRLGSSTISTAEISVAYVHRVRPLGYIRESTHTGIVGQVLLREGRDLVRDDMHFRVCAVNRTWGDSVSTFPGVSEPLAWNCAKMIDSCKRASP